MKFTVMLTLMAGQALAIGQALDGHPIGHQLEKDHFEKGI